MLALRLTLATWLARDPRLARLFALMLAALGLDMLTTAVGFALGSGEGYPGAHMLVSTFGGAMMLAIVITVHLMLLACLWQLVAIWPACRRFAYAMAGFLLVTHTLGALWNLVYLTHAYLG